jgi:hypothetical protein
MVLSIKYSTNLNKREAARIEYPAIGATSFVSIVVYLTCTIRMIPIQLLSYRKKKIDILINKLSDHNFDPCTIIRKYS